MLAEWPQASADDSWASGAGPADTDLPAARGRGRAASTGEFGARSPRKKRGVLRRTGIALPAAGLALLLVVVVWGAAKVMNPQGTGANSLFQSIDGLGHSGSVALLEQERQTLIQMTDASNTLTVASKPAMTDPQQIMAQNSASSSSSSSTNSTGGGTGVTTLVAPADPTAAQQTAQSMLSSFGFGSSQWSCLYSLWERESGWNVYASNPSSGAYGIPQSLPGYKMASAGSDWQTDAATQIRWGLGYIKSTYGTPCAAWQNEVNYGYY